MKHLKRDFEQQQRRRNLCYDPLGPLWRVNAASDLRYFYDGRDMVAQYDSSGNLQNRYVFGPGTD